MTRRATLTENHPCRDCNVSNEALCCALDDETLANFRSQGNKICLVRGQALFHQGDHADCVFSVTSGVLKLYTILPDGRRHVVAFFFPGEFIGLYEGQTHSCTAEAVSPVTLCRFHKARFEHFADSSPSLARARYQRAASELAAAQAQIITLGRKTAGERLAHFIHDIHERTSTGISGTSRLVPLLMSRIDMADYLGLTKETVSREFTLLRSARIIRPHNLKLVEILDLARLQNLASGAGIYA